MGQQFFVLERQVMKIPNVDTLSTFVDRLCIENLKIMNLEHKKWKEVHKENPDHEAISKWHLAMRTAAEARSALKNRIDELFKECVESGRYDYLSEARDF